MRYGSRQGRTDANASIRSINKSGKGLEKPAIRKAGPNVSELAENSVVARTPSGRMPLPAERFGPPPPYFDCHLTGIVKARGNRCRRLYSKRVPDFCPSRPPLGHGEHTRLQLSARSRGRMRRNFPTTAAPKSAHFFVLDRCEDEYDSDVDPQNTGSSCSPVRADAR